MRRTTFGFIGFLIIGLLLAGYYFYNRYSGEVAEAIKAVPQDAAFVIECRNPGNTLFNLNRSEYWQRMINLPSARLLGQQLAHIDSIFSNDHEFAYSWKQKPLIISAHITRANDFDWLFLFEVKRGINQADVPDLLKKIFSTSGNVNKREYEDVSVYEMGIGNGQTFSFALHKGILICSLTSFLVEDALRQLKSHSSLKTNKSFFSVYKASGKNTDADLYFNYKSFSRLLNIFIQQNAALPGLDLWSSLADWTEADVKLNPSAILSTGLTSVKDTSQFLNLIYNQSPQEMKMADILPERTSCFFHLGLSNSKAFFEKLHHSKFVGSVPEYLKKNLTSWVGNEMALVVTESNTANFSNNTFACIEAADTTEAIRSLDEVANTNGSSKIEMYHGHKIGCIKLDGLLSSIYGRIFDPSANGQKNYFTCLSNFIVFANQSSSLRTFIDGAESKKVLSANRTFRQVLENSEASSNVFVYINIPASLTVLHSFTSTAKQNIFDESSNPLLPVNSGLNAVAFQYTNKGKQLYNHFVLQFSEEIRKAAALVWTAQCDTSVSAQPRFVTDGSNNYFAVQDDANKLYFIDESGQVIWKKQLNERILSNIYPVDFFHNGTYQFLFNTGSYLYVVDKAGAFLGNYPIKLPATASNGCTVVDFDNTHDFKIFVACVNQLLYAYEANGKAMNGWLYNKPLGTVTRPIRYFKSNGKDYLLVTANDGKMEMLDRRGALRSRVTEKVSVSPLSEIVTADTVDNSLPGLVFADTTGSIFTLSMNCNISKIYNNHLKQPVYFNSADINDDHTKEYILYGNNTLTVLKDTNLVYSHEYKNAEGLSIYVSNGLVGSVSFPDNEITIYSPDGTVYPGFPVKGSTPFTVASLNNDGKRYIAVGSKDGSLYLYVLE